MPLSISKYQQSYRSVISSVKVRTIICETKTVANGCMNLEATETFHNIPYGNDVIVSGCVENIFGVIID